MMECALLGPGGPGAGWSCSGECGWVGGGFLRTMPFVCLRLWVCGGWFRLYVENYIVDASIFAAVLAGFGWLVLW